MLHILIVDDEELNLDIISEYLEDTGYKLTPASNGQDALDIIANQSIDLVILDRMMPGMDGLQVVQTLKNNPQYTAIPIIMQTAAASNEQILEGIRAGVYYYLAKPYKKNMLLGIVNSALQHTHNRNEKQKNDTETQAINLIATAEFYFRTHHEANNLAHLLSSTFPDPDAAERGLKELMYNAVEHGNLGISYNEKNEYITNGIWNEEVHKRLQLEQNITKVATLLYTMSDKEIKVSIQDQGKGFDWQRYVDFEPIRMTDPNGRGIAMTKAVSFPNMEYNDRGNEVVCRIPLNPRNT